MFGTISEPLFGNVKKTFWSFSEHAAAAGICWTILDQCCSNFATMLAPMWADLGTMLSKTVSGPLWDNLGILWGQFREYLKTIVDTILKPFKHNLGTFF